MTYAPAQLAVIVPTKDRPEKLRNLLDTLCSQTAPCGRIVIVDGGASVRDVVLAYADRLPVEHYICQPPGQIRQRNMAIGLLDDRTPLVACMDDDIEFEPGAIAAMIAFWNRCEPETAAVAFNVVNVPTEPNTWLRRLFYLAGSAPGRILPSGMSTGLSQAPSDFRVEWVPGGATVWRLDILRSHQHRELPGRWAISEDLIYSYAIGHRHPLYVCASARVRHEHVFDYRVKQPDRFHGRTQTLWLFHFVESNRELSLAAFLWMIGGTAAGRVLAGLATVQPRHIRFAGGQIEAVLKVLAARFRGGNAAGVIEREARAASASR